MTPYPHRPDSASLSSGKRSIWYDRNGNPISGPSAAPKSVASSPRYRDRRTGAIVEPEKTETEEKASTLPIENPSVPSPKAEPLEDMGLYRKDPAVETAPKTEDEPMTVEREESFLETTDPASPEETTDTQAEITEPKSEETAAEAETDTVIENAQRQKFELRGITSLAVLYLLPLFVLFSAGYILYRGPKAPELPAYDMAAFEARVPYRYIGSFNRDFNDLNDLQLSAARKIGIKPATTRKALKERKGLVPVRESPTLSIDPLTHSQALLVPEAAVLLNEIGAKFTATLSEAGLPLYSIIVTSVTRTDEDVKDLRKGNGNASDNSTHVYGTTFDISWRRFHKSDPFDPRDLSPDELKHLLAIVLSDFHDAGRCYIKHERYQACFHITTKR